MKTLHERLKVTTRKIKDMKEGENRIFTERLSGNPGTMITSKANSIGIKVKTQSCWIIVPKTKKLIKAVIVTKL